MAGQKQIQIAPATTVEVRYPVSPMQEGMVLASLSAPHSGAHVTQIIGTLTEALHAESFHDAWNRVVKRHAILRTRFRMTDSGPRQEVHHQVRLPLDLKDWRSLPPREQAKRLESHFAADRRRGFECGRPRLCV